MRFSTLVALMLPLSALAVPSLFKRAPAANEDELNKELKSFSNSLLATNTALQDILDPSKGAPLPKPEIQNLLDEAKKAQNKIQNAIINTANKTVPLILAKKKVDPNDQLIITQNVFNANAIISSFQKNFIDRTSGFSSKSDTPERKTLVGFITTAVTEVGNATKSGVNILRLQGLDGLLAQVVPGSGQ